MYDGIDQWLDWGDHTVTVDPIRNEAWLRPGIEDRHTASKERGQAYDSENTLHMMELLKKDTVQPVSMYLPAFKTLNEMPRYQSGNAKMGTWRGELRDVRGAGELPVIRKKRDDDALPSAPSGAIERETHEARHDVSERIFDRSGVPDHGLPSESSHSFQNV